ncbi:MAG: class I SAM-dependent methyltransferase [Gemmataceae bacterium]|nr:class I SAM-dependent methyltransferase [Gemmata sp.]MDW8196073.1 class I SAM-dependent methyltransferase [Gemmataceae bacterium]
MITNRPVVGRLDTPPHFPAIEWEEAACPQCGSNSTELFLEAPDPLPPENQGLIFAVVRCCECHLIYTNPRPSPNSISRFYPADYRPHRRASKMRQTRSVHNLYSRLFGRPCQERRGLLPWPKPGRLLDFGCGGGSFLKTMAEQGWQVTGLDAAVGAVEHVRDQHGLTALVGTLPHPDLQPCSFDVITMWHSLEHVHQPLTILREAYQLLIPGGQLIVATPNIASWPFRFFRTSWFGLDLPRHLTHFTPTTLRMILENAGFRLKSLRPLRHSDWLRSSARLAQRHHHGGLLTQTLRWKPLAKLAAWLCYLAGQSDCILAIAERPA